MRQTITLLALLLAASTASADPPRPSPAAAEADRAVLLADRTGHQLLSLLDEHRRARDVIRVGCLDDALSQVNSFARTLESRRARLIEAEQRRDAAAVRHERRVIRTLHRQLRELAHRGRSCVMPGGTVDGRTVVVVTIERGTPEIDVSDIDPPRDRP